VALQCYFESRRQNLQLIKLGVFKKSAIVLRTELEGDAHQAFKAVELKIPPRILNNPSGIRENVVVRV